MDQSAAGAPSTAPSTEVIAICMVCNTRVPTDTVRCPTCGLEPCLMRKCPACSQLVSAKHVKCIYCSEPFVEPPTRPGREVPWSWDTSRPKITARALAVSVVVFASVFTFLLVVTRMYGPPAVAIKGKIGTSYALYRAPVFVDDSLSGAPVGHLKSGDIVDVTDFASPGLRSRWVQISSPDRRGFVAVADLAPLKADVEVYGYQALRAYMLAVSDSQRLGLTADAVSYYAKKFPKSPRAAELLWDFAERCRETGLANNNADNLRRARSAYTELAAVDGAYKAQAQERLNELPTGEAAEKRSVPARREVKPLEVVGNAEVRSAGGHSSVREVTLITQAEIFATIPSVSAAQPGIVVEGRIARDIRSSRGNAIPAGAVCYITLLNATNGFTAQLTGISVGKAIVPVSTAPVHVARSKSSAGVDFQQLTFKLTSPIALAK